MPGRGSGDGRFNDRRDAGRRLAEALAPLQLTSPLVVALPRGGVPVGAEVARAFDGDLDVIVVRKIGAPLQPELGVGAVAEGGDVVWDEATLGHLRLTRADLATTVERERAELQRRVVAYRGARPLRAVDGRIVVVVDDGLATGGTARAALRALQQHQPERLVLAVPVGPADAGDLLAGEADDVIVAVAPRHLTSVGQWYDDFTQTTDEEVRRLLRDFAV